MSTRRALESHLHYCDLFSIKYPFLIVGTELGVEIDIHDNRIQAYFYYNLDQTVRENPTALLTDTTYTFMENFDIRPIVLQKITEQLKILHAHSNAVAFYQAKDNFYMLTAKKSYMEFIMHELSSIVSIDDTLKSILSSVAFTDHETIKTIDGQQVSTCVIPSSLYNSTTTDDQYIVTDDIISKSVTLSFKTPTHTALFTRTTFQSNLQIYFHTKYSVKLYFEPTVNINSSTLIKIIGRQSTIDLAIQELETLVSLCRTKTFNETTDHDWTKINDAIHVIQYHLDTMNIKCVCQQQIAPASIMVHYIDKTHIEFGVDEQIIEKLCRETLISVICTSTIVEKEWAALKSRILQRDNYGKDISLLDEQQTISLFGLPEIVKQVQQLFEDKKATTNSSMRKNQLRKARTEPIRKLQGEKSEHWSPSNNDTLNQESNQSKQKTIETYSITFDIDEPGFEVLVNKSFNRLLAIIESKCQLEKEIIHHPIQIEIPKSKVNHSDDSTSHNKSQEDNPKSMDDASSTSMIQPSLSAVQMNSTTQAESASIVDNIARVAIGNSKIVVCTADLTKQSVDAIVVCSTQTIVRDNIIAAAGEQVKHAFDECSSSATPEIETTGGNLPCKQIIFRSWIFDKIQIQNLRPSIARFVTSVISYALHNKLTTIAFPSIDCESLDVDPKLIAEYMIDETYQQLKNSIHSSLIISFVLLPQQQSVFDAFADQLETIRIIENKPASVVFDKQSMEIERSQCINLYFD
ncbi:unnamed protein product [Rotaria sp. Silwood2]|nr:unnamed protein product [Rotaria sp. Silwood2]